MIANGAIAYRRTQIQTAHPAQLVVQLYEGAMRFVERAIAALERRDVEGAHFALTRTQDIIVQLRATLNLDAGPVASGLDDLYDVLYQKLVLANVRKDATVAHEILGYLQELLGAWQVVAREAMAADRVTPETARIPLAAGLPVGAQSR